jgi:chaperone required for assembly of F1-ATPase
MTDKEQGPMQAAQRAMRPPLPKRFYKTVSVSERGGEYAINLDGKPARTPAKRLLATPSLPLSEALAAEWAGVQDTIDPARMPLTRLANVAIDRIADHPQEVIAEVMKYAGSDLVCYRASEPEGLVAMQNGHWTPVLDWARNAFGARFRLCEGVRFVEQDAGTIAAFRTEVEKLAQPFALAALASATQVTGSALIALALARGAITPDAAWNAAHVDEDWQISQWGDDAEARERRDFRRADFDAAAAVLRFNY